jgi:putative SOS response-associated peptidase YedK
MCGRFTLFLPAEQMQLDLGLGEIPVDYQARINIAPSQPVAIVRNIDSRNLEWARWGLIPSWAKDAAIGSRMINARAETLPEKPSFRPLLHKKRCLILANGFYEWQKKEPTKAKGQPYFFQLKDEKPFAFAGLWDHWQPEPDKDVVSCTIITCPANECVAPVHERMPVMLSADTCYDWIQPGSVDKLMPMLSPFDPTLMEAFPVSRAVNSPGYEGPELIRPAQ